uniref:Uncharacterized protein n=1 Tax=Anguilla anguilla TaxID=7936 RepID=A0A0E9W8Q7_ANGAN
MFTQLTCLHTAVPITLSYNNSLSS